MQRMKQKNSIKASTASVKLSIEIFVETIMSVVMEKLDFDYQAKSVLKKSQKFELSGFLSRKQYRYVFK